MGYVSATRPHIPWQQTAGMYLAGQEWIDEVDLVQIEIERKWGRDRLRLLVPPELREKFDRQRYLFKQAMWEGQLEDVKREAQRMITALRACDKKAEELGKQKLSASVWEVVLDDGRVAAIVREPELMQQVIAEGRHVIVYDLQELGKMLTFYSHVMDVKAEFPGATVTKVTDRIKDPFSAMSGLDTHGIFDITAPIDDVKSFEDGDIPF